MRTCLELQLVHVVVVQQFCVVVRLTMRNWTMIVVVVLDINSPAFRAFLCMNRLTTICLHCTCVLLTFRLMGLWVFGISVFAAFGTAIGSP